MITKHTSEPWVYETDGEEVYIIGDSGLERVCTLSRAGTGARRRDASRIISCVGACSGMADPARELAALRAQRDELREALRLAMNTLQANGGHTAQERNAAVDKARAALARCGKEGA